MKRVIGLVNMTGREGIRGKEQDEHLEAQQESCIDMSPNV